KLGFKIIHSTVKLLPAWHEILEALKMRVTTLPWDVSTCWNSTFDMVEYALRNREAIDAVTQRQDLGLRQLELTDHEWVIAEQLQDILKDATLFFLRSTPNLATVIPAMDLIDEKLTTYSLNASFLPSIRVAVGLAKKTLNRYYQLTDTSEVYHIAMGEFLS
ncbi:uncharacterized protein F5891DRAFT_952567, partial [Suillus fuscotomentosus]